jgi:hypothetical protein
MLEQSVQARPFLQQMPICPPQDQSNIMVDEIAEQTIIWLSVEV